MCLIYFPAQPSFIHGIRTQSLLSLSSLHTTTVLTDSFLLCYLLSSLEHLQPIPSSHNKPLEWCSPQLLCFCDEVIKRPWVGSSVGRVPRLGFILKVQAFFKFPWTLGDFSVCNVALLGHILILQLWSSGQVQFVSEHHHQVFSGQDESVPFTSFECEGHFPCLLCGKLWQDLLVLTYREQWKIPETSVLDLLCL